jgi:hypothetical protein
MRRVAGEGATFFTIGDARFFPGVVALLNTLRLAGHDEELVVLDCGLAPGQRAALAPHCTLVVRSRALVHNPQQYKAFPHTVGASGVVVVVDSDLYVTRSLAPFLARAAGGRICVFADLEPHRWFAEWSSAFELAEPLRRETYVNSGFVCFSTAHHPELLGRWWAACERTFAHRTIYEGAAHGLPMSQSDQDALNAVLMSEVAPGAVALQPGEDELFPWQFRELDAIDVAALDVRWRGHRPALVHAAGWPKVWETAGWWTVAPAYAALARRALTWPDVAVPLPAETLPVWLRPGWRGGASVRAVAGASRTWRAARSGARTLATTAGRRSARRAAAGPVRAVR